jgi:hypothetical protein
VKTISSLFLIVSVAPPKPRRILRATRIYESLLEVRQFLVAEPKSSASTNSATPAANQQKR